MPARDLTVIANTADDDEFWGLLVCPDVDAVIYRLAGVFNDEAGYGVKDDTFHVARCARSGSARTTWFRIGDKDFATHLAPHGDAAARLHADRGVRSSCAAGWASKRACCR